MNANERKYPDLIRLGSKGPFLFASICVHLRFVFLLT